MSHFLHHEGMAKIFAVGHVACNDDVKMQTLQSDVLE